MAEKIIDVEVEEETKVENEIPAEETVEKKTVGSWLKECPIGKGPKAKKVRRIVTGVVAGCAIAGAAAWAYFAHGAAADVPELPDGLDDPGLLPDGTADLTDVAETLVE